jgi:hypothetical protein
MVSFRNELKQKYEKYHFLPLLTTLLISLTTFDLTLKFLTVRLLASLSITAKNAHTKEKELLIGI